MKRVRTHVETYGKHYAFGFAAIAAALGIANPEATTAIAVLFFMQAAILEV